MPVDARKADGYEPRFDIDASYGRQGELFVSSIIDALTGGSVEVKRDSRFAKTGNVYVEYECRKRGPGRSPASPQPRQNSGHSS